MKAFMKNKFKIFIISAAFLFTLVLGINLLQQNNFAVMAAGNEATITINMLNGGKEIEVGGSEVELEADPESSEGTLTGTTTIDITDQITIQAFAMEYYEFEKFEITFSSLGIETSTISPTANPYVLSDIALGTDEIEINVYFKLKVLNVQIIGRYITDLGNTSGADLSALTAPETGFWSSTHRSDDGQPVDLELGQTIYFVNDWGTQYDGNSRTMLDHYLIRNKDGGNERFELSTVSQWVGEDFLEDYLYNNQILITAVYKKEHKINIVSNNNFDKASVTLKLIHYNGGEEDFELNEFEQYIEEGAQLLITPHAEEHYVFSHFMVSESRNNADTLNINNINEPLNIEVIFEKTNYRLTVIGIDTKGNEVPSAKNNVTIYLENGVAAGFLKLGDVLKSIDFTDLTNYNTLGFSIKAGKDTIPFSQDMDVNADFLKRYLANSEVVIIINLERLFTVSIVNSVNQVTNAQMGYYTVEYFDEEADTFKSTNETTFEVGKILRITAIPYNYYTFTGFSGVTAGEKNGNVITLTLKADRPINISFKAEVFNLVNSTPTFENGTVEISKTAGLKLNDVIYITLNASSSYDIVSWKLNDIYTVNNLPANATFENNIITLKLTDEWLSENGFTIKSHIEFGLKPGIILSIALPSVAIVILAAILVWFALVNLKRKKVIRLQLQQENATRVTLNAGSFIQDLRDGKNVGQVTDADVKKAMKERKNKK